MISRDTLCKDIDLLLKTEVTVDLPAELVVNQDKDHECPVCREPKLTRTLALALPCKHEFCHNCLQWWYIRSVREAYMPGLFKCPLCRSLIQVVNYNYSAGRTNFKQWFINNDTPELNSATVVGPSPAGYTL